MELEFYGQILETYMNINFQEFRPVGAELFRVDRQTDRYDECNSRFY